MDIDMLFGILIFDPKRRFSKLPIFKMVSFLEYIVFFQAVFCKEQLEMTSRLDFDMFSRIHFIHDCVAA